MITEPNTRLAKCLAVLCADWSETKPSRTADMRKQKFEGACWSANALGYGMTPNDVFMTVADWVRANPRPVSGAVEHKAWSNRVVAEVAPAIAKLV